MWVRRFILEEEMLAEKNQGFPVLNDKRAKSFKEKDAIQNAWEKVTKSSNLQEMVILLEQAATEKILKIADLEKLMPCSVSGFLTKY